MTTAANRDQPICPTDRCGRAPLRNANLPHGDACRPRAGRQRRRSSRMALSRAVTRRWRARSGPSGPRSRLVTLAARAKIQVPALRQQPQGASEPAEQNCTGDGRIFRDLETRKHGHRSRSRVVRFTGRTGSALNAPRSKNGSSSEDLRPPTQRRSPTKQVTRTTFQPADPRPQCVRCADPRRCRLIEESFHPPSTKRNLSLVASSKMAFCFLERRYRLRIGSLPQGTQAIIPRKNINNRIFYWGITSDVLAIPRRLADAVCTFRHLSQSPIPARGSARLSRTPCPSLRRGPVAERRRDRHGRGGPADGCRRDRRRPPWRRQMAWAAGARHGLAGCGGVVRPT